MQIGGGGVVDVVDLNNKTLYASPYLVYNEQGYSKHYYAGAERVSSRIGGGMQNALLHPLDSVAFNTFLGYPEHSEEILRMMNRSVECSGFSLSHLSMEPRLHTIEGSIHHSDPEPNWYIYHSDHLGSSAFLTDASGDPTQHLQYMPFGETFVEQRSVTSYYTPYTFSAKERDLETGYSYFGARYYDADISVWLSVDPMADKYPSMSAYMYCAGNPVMLVDPDGREPMSQTRGFGWLKKMFNKVKSLFLAPKNYNDHIDNWMQYTHADGSPSGIISKPTFQPYVVTDSQNPYTDITNVSLEESPANITKVIDFVSTVAEKTADGVVYAASGLVASIVNGSRYAYRSVTNQPPILSDDEKMKMIGFSFDQGLFLETPYYGSEGIMDIEDGSRVLSGTTAVVSAGTGVLSGFRKPIMSFLYKKAVTTTINQAAKPEDKLE
jgi:RHS repeat-associated protein